MSKNKPDTSEETFQEGTTNRPRPKSPSSAADTSAETFQEGATGQPRPKPTAAAADSSAETFQEGMTPVQAFASPVLPAGLGTDDRLRQGRPPRVAPAKAPE